MVQDTKTTRVVENIPLDQINPNPYQPTDRLEGDPADIEKMAQSIQTHGLISIPVGRRANGKVEMGDGWLRYLAHRQNFSQGLLAFGEMPVVIKDITDQQMADMVIQANTVRHDLSPLGEAELYKRYLEDFKVTQKELAELHNCSQGEIANTIRLLELPDSIKAKVISGELPRTHARQLLRLSRLPEEQEKTTTRAIKQSLTVNGLVEDIDRVLWNASTSIDPKDETWEKPVFDLSECKNCEHRNMVTSPYWGSNGKKARCFDEVCYKTKQAEAKEAQLKAAREAVANKGGKGGYLTSDELRGNEYEDMREIAQLLDNPKECKDCEKKALYKYSHEHSMPPWRVCLDPACYRKKKTKRTKDTNKQAKLDDRALTVKLGGIFQQVHHSPKECMLVLARHVVPQLSADGRRDIVVMFELPTLANGQLNVDALLASLAGKSLEELTQLAVAATITSGRRGSYSDQYSPELKEREKRNLAIVTGGLPAYIAEVTAFQEANCRGCENSKGDEVIGTGEECCQWTYNKKINSKGKCEGRKKRKEEPTAEASPVEPEEEVTVGASEG